jgi:hypothetical protein
VSPIPLLYLFSCHACILLLPVVFMGRAPFYLFLFLFWRLEALPTLLLCGGSSLFCARTVCFLGMLFCLWRMFLVRYSYSLAVGGWTDILEEEAFYAHMRLKPVHRHLLPR